MIDLSKYTCVINNKIYIAYLSHLEDYSDFTKIGYTGEQSRGGNNLRLYSFDIFLSDESKELIVDNLKDYGISTMTAIDDNTILLATGSIPSSFSPILQIINVIDKTVTVYPLDTSVQEIIDLL